MHNKKTYIKITDKYIYLYQNKLITYESKYIKKGCVDNVPKFINYLSNILGYSFIKKKYIFILDTLLSNSDIFVYRYVFDSLGLINYKIINDLNIISPILNDNTIVIFNWTSSINYAYKVKNEIRCYPLNIPIINKLDRKYILLVGDTPISQKIKKTILTHEYSDNNIFNYI